MDLRPTFLDLRRLEGRIVVLFMGLLLVVQLASFGLIQNSIRGNAETSIAAELKTGDRVFRRLLRQEAEKRSDAAALLAQDYGFKTAISLSLDEAANVETVQDALINQGERIGASVVAYFDNELKLVAASRPDAQRFHDLLAQKVAQKGLQKQAPSRAAGGNDDVELALLDGKAYQVVAVQVRTPAPVGWILMGFLLDSAALQDLRTLSELQGVVVVRTDGQGRNWTSLASSLDAAATRGVTDRVPAASGLFSTEVGGEQWRGQLAALEPGAQYRLGVVLLRSFDAAVAPYRQLQLLLLALTLIGLAVSALASVLLARRISGPIHALSQAAARLGSGDYETPIDVPASTEEVGGLAAAFEAMRQGIRTQTAKAERQAYWDELTGLPNRARFRGLLEAELALEAPFAVLMLDMDRFKHVNDVLGHDVGDELLKSVGLRLLALADASGADLARLAGDEFALLLRHGDEAAALHLAQTILQDFKRPLHIGDHLIDIGAGIGIALSPVHGRDAMQLLSHVELAMYAAKQRQSGSMVYDAALDAGSQQSLSLLSELRRAIEGNELRLYLQPKLDFKTGQVASAEALVRWLHPQRGLVPPMQFIPFAEQTGFIGELTRWVTAEAARAVREAADAGIALKLSVNLSTRDLLGPDLPARIAAQLAEQGVQPASICLEITESAIMDDPQRALATLDQLSSMGFKLSIDDFGTGYSSLAYLKRLPVDELKIDKSFVMAMERDLDDAKIVRSTIELAHNLGLSVVAEGVETSKALQLLEALGCDQAQGYFIGKPMPSSEFGDWLSRWATPERGEAPNSVLAGLQ
ncbi:bifunctional diguanylate cyclase/phosphodiesterase [Pelomonas sp. KK5]|uniref:putative bifunctional diguanylate cyclase/phosphodiesterase n=1 Tax=Pelomonas sp. KK5 TaxID=1855730 RepID=UPI0009F96624|nr:EAL domain-containing protein [Pelomonas sp. KK5]